MYANIIVDISNEKLDRVFTYSVPKELESKLTIGSLVTIPFGKGNREITGYIIGFSNTVDFDPEKTKSILRVEEKGIPIESRSIALAAWMKEHYGGTMIQSLKTVLPIKKKENMKQKKKVQLLLKQEEAKQQLAYFCKKNQKARARLLEGLLKQPEQEYELLTKKLNVTSSVIKALEKNGILKVTSEQNFRNPIHYKKTEEKDIQYNTEQKHAINTFVNDYDRGIRKTYLLHGITGSGKTEVYMEMIGHVISEGKQAIVLIPEIALTYQTVLRFYGKFGERVTILNSKMSAGERSDQMQRVKEGKIDVMIGPRSALFTPFSDLGLIVIDEEHETSYKSEQVPKYHARETAVEKAFLENASVVLGSATPSMEAYYRCKIGEYQLLELTQRASENELAHVDVVDLREELRNGNRSIISDKLRELMTDRLKKKQQIMLFINRRGYAGFISCRECGYVVKCPHCDVSLSAHQNGRWICHYCGYETQEIHTCPVCGSNYLGRFKAGTQQVETIIKREFPEARVLRMDFDTTRLKEGHEKILSAFSNGEADILIGTQMIVKGHDFPNVTLVGVLAADLSLYASDYCSGERTFQLLTQAAGRAGRGSEPGEVVIQTYSPEHYSIQMAAKQDYEGFYEQEMDFRSVMGYPPVNKLMAVLVAEDQEEHLEIAAGYLKEFAVKADKKHKLRVIGPAVPHVGKVNDEFRRMIYIKCEDDDYLIEIKDLMERYIEINNGFSGLRIQFDFNPITFF